MKATRIFWPSASSPFSVEEESASAWPCVHALARAHARALVDAGVLVGAHELLQQVFVLGAFVVHDHDPGRLSHYDRALLPRQHHLARVAGRLQLDARAHDRRSRHEQRHRLALHVRTHQGAVGVVVLQERDQRRRDRHDLLGRHVHVVHAVGRLLQEVLVVAQQSRSGPRSARHLTGARSPAR